MSTFVLVNQDAQPLNQHEIVTTEQFGINILLNYNVSNYDPDNVKDVTDALAALGTGNLRYPGGTVTEDFAQQVFANDSTLPLTRTDFLLQCASSNVAANIVIPTILGFMESAGTALLHDFDHPSESAHYGNRTVSEAYLQSVTAYVSSFMADAYAKGVAIQSLEIGNEFWLGGQMTAKEYGALAAAVLVAAEQGISDAIANNPALASLPRPDLLVQSVHAAGAFSPHSSTATLYVDRATGVAYSDSSKIPDADKLFEVDVHVADQGDAAHQLTDLTSSLNNSTSRSLIDGVVDHAYARTGFAGIDTATSENYVYYQMGKFEQLIGDSVGSLQRYVTEWNTVFQNNSVDYRGLSGAAMLTEIFYEMTSHGVQHADIWPLFGTVNCLATDTGELTVAGTMFKLMAESLVGTTPVLDDNLTVGGIEIDVHGFSTVDANGVSGGTHIVLFTSNRSAVVANDVTLDLNHDTITFDTHLNTLPYFITETQLSANDSLGGAATGNDGTAVTPHLNYSDGVVHTDLGSGDLIAFTDLAASGSMRTEITFITAGNDLIEGRGGNDLVYGASGNDTLIGNEGNDSLAGDDGADSLAGGTGNDILNGGSGNDTLMANDGNDNVNGDDGDDSLDGGNGNDIIYGGTGDDHLTGSAGNDTMSGDNGNDQLNGGNGSDSLIGGAGFDTIWGGNGNDLIFGNAGNDSLTGGNGNDTISGSSGADVFRYNATTDGVDTITDFTTTASNSTTHDQIDLSAIDAIAGSSNDAFFFSGSGNFHSIAGELVYQQSLNGQSVKITTVQADINGDSVADLSIILTGWQMLSATDFVL